ncbi:MAG: TetR/AcrR family transcriptional regulator [Mailhella sp.]|nr:TetR/AcrR family transcriptional regulator [Mailhella sp.]
MELFASYGVKAVSVGQIAKAAGVTSAMVHYHFGSRDGLLGCLITERLAPHFRQALDSALGSGEDMESLVDSLTDSLFSLCAEMPSLPQLWVREVLCDGGALRQGLLSNVMNERLDDMTALFSQLQPAAGTGLSARLVFPTIISIVMLPLAAQNFFREIPLIGSVGLDEMKRHAHVVLQSGICKVLKEASAP